jgi:3,4-dihydroxy 2-butanone 4-phosphate synthase/GTP cyclohydrolase II
MVVVVDDADREDEGDLVAAAAAITEQQVAVIVWHPTGILCAPMPAQRVDVLNLPQMVVENTDNHATAFTVTVDHVSAGTGVSAAGRQRTLRAPADPDLRPDELRRPGHVFPLRAREGACRSGPGTPRAPSI